MSEVEAYKIQKPKDLKKFLSEEAATTEGSTVNPSVEVTVYIEEDSTFLQMCGWGIRLMDDGTWFIEDTSGG